MRVLLLAIEDRESDVKIRTVTFIKTTYDYAAPFEDDGCDFFQC